MQRFYKKALVALILMLAADALLAWFCIGRSDLSAPLIPRAPGSIPWRPGTVTDAALGGTSTVRVVEPGTAALRFDFQVTNAASYPFVSVDMLLEDGHGHAATRDTGGA